MRNDIHIHPTRLIYAPIRFCITPSAGTHPHQAPAPLLAPRDPSIHNCLHIPLQSFPKILEHGRTTGQDDVFIQPAPDIDRRRLDDRVYDLRKGSEEVRVQNLRVKEYLGGEEAFIADVEVVFLCVISDTNGQE